MRRIIAGPLPPQIPNMQGKVHSLKVLQGIGGTVKASPDFTVQTPGAATFTDAQSNAWKLYGTTEISNRKYRMHGEVASWPQGWDPSGSEVYVSVTANGLLRRLNQGNRPVVSAMRRYWTKVSSPHLPRAYSPSDNAAAAPPPPPPFPARPPPPPPHAAPPATGHRACGVQGWQAGAAGPGAAAGRRALPNNGRGAGPGGSVNANGGSPAAGPGFGPIVVQGIQAARSALAGPLAAWAGEPA